MNLAIREGRVPRRYDLEFSKSQRRVLMGLKMRPSELEATNTTNLLLERKGFIRRVAGPRPSRTASHAVILWEITEAGAAMLAEG